LTLIVSEIVQDTDIVTMEYYVNRDVHTPYFNGVILNDLVIL